MAKKRKLTPKSGESQKQKQKKQEQEEEEEHQLLNQVVTEAQEPEEEEEQEDEEAEIEGEEEEEEEEETVKQEEDTVKQEENNDDDGEPIHKLLEPFSKEQLINILAEVAEKHAQIAARVRRIADEDPVHRKIFVHGLGWDTTTETLQTAFVQYGEIEDCKSVTDKVTGKSKGYGFILFKSRSGARKALEQPQKKIGSRMASCQLAAVGPGPGPTSVASASSQAVALNQPVSEYIQRKIYVSNVGAELDPQKLYAFFAKFGEIEEGPLGLDKQTGKPKGFCLFVYKTAESAKKALEEPHKNFEGQILHCQQANDGQKAGKQQFNQQRNSQYGRNNSNNNMNYAGSVGGVAQGGGQIMGQTVSAMPFNQGAAVAAPGAYNPALNQALTALLSSQNGLGLQNLLGPLGTNGAVQGIQGAYGNQALNMGMLGGYGAQTGVQNAYTNQQQGGARTQHGNGHMGGMPPYTGR